MKTFNFKSLLNLSLMAGLLVSTVLVSSCKSDDDDDDPIGPAPTANGKKLAFVKNDGSTARFEYDDKGRVLTVTESGLKIVFNYTDNEVTTTETYSSSTSATQKTYKLTNGRITQKIRKSNSEGDSDYITNFTYDGNGCLTSENYTYTSTSGQSNKSNTTKKKTYIWKDGNIDSETSEYSYESTETYSSEVYESVNGRYQYVTKTNTTKHSSSEKKVTNYSYSEHAYTLPAAEADADDILRWQGFFGKKNTRLVAKAQSSSTTTSSTTSSNSNESQAPVISNSSKTVEYSYNFNDGILVKIFATTTDNDNRVKVEETEFSWN